MPAHVQSTESIELVRSALVDFRERVDQALVMVDLEVRRMLEWLEHDRPKYWKHQIHLAHDGVAEARAALHRCLMFPVTDERPSCREERAALRKAQAHLAYCEEKGEQLKHWIREIRSEMFDYQGRVGGLSMMNEIDIPQAIGTLTKILRRLEEYAATEPRGERLAANLQLVEEIFGAESTKEQETDETDREEATPASESSARSPAKPESE